MNKIILSDIEKSKEIYPVVLNETRKYGRKMDEVSTIDFLNNIFKNYLK